MKFSKLKDRFSALKKKYDGKKNIKAKDLKELRALLKDRRRGYKEKLKSDLSDRKRRRTQMKIRVINAQMKKVDKLLDN